jgi:serine phosphatase RsbU (regulator of sigma subunit)
MTLPTEAPPVLRPNDASATETPFHILLVEDSDTQAMRLQAYLEGRDWRVTRAATTAEARARLFDAGRDFAPDRPLFDLMLLDYHLPDGRGDAFCRELRSSDGTQTLPILLLTSSEEEHIELTVLSSGADDYVSKAAPIDVLLTRLSTLLNKARAHHELNKRYQREHRVAQVLQEALLSAAPADAFPGLTIRTEYEPAWDEALVGGDFYDIRTLDDDRTALVVGDVTGKGLAAATYTAEVKFALRAFLHEYPEPGAAMGRLNDFLVEHSRRNPWANSALVAVCLATCDTATGVVRLACGGTEPPLLMRYDPATGAVTAEEVQSHGPLLGIIPGHVFPTTDLHLAPGDILMIFTDGITEARQRRSRDMLGYERVIEVTSEILRQQHGAMDPVVSGLVAEAKRFSGGRLQDDVCLIAIQRSGAVV